MDDDSFPSFFSDQRVRVNEALDRLLPDPEENRLAEAMRYSVLGGGKRIRGVLVLEVARITDANSERLAEDLSGIVELLHAYTLVHDDLPAMDDDEYRRGQPACHREYDEVTAMLCGNALQSLAFKSASQLDLDKSDLSWVIRRIGEIIGYNGVLEGQLKDLSLEGTEPTEETVLDMYTKKTGYLLGLALELGAVAADMDEELRNRIGRVGHKLGVGFQIHDDLLERSADSKKLGKDTGSDRNKNKSTLVKRIGEDSARDRSRAFIDEGQTLLENFPYNTTRLQELANFLVERTY